MNAEDYDAACSLVFESFEANGLSAAMDAVAGFFGVAMAESVESMAEAGRALRFAFLREHNWQCDDAQCWAEPGSNKYRWAAHQAETEQRRRLRATAK